LINHNMSVIQFRSERFHFHGATKFMPQYLFHWGKI
jgi:hypothetical protein